MSRFPVPLDHQFASQFTQGQRRLAIVERQLQQTTAVAQSLTTPFTWHAPSSFGTNISDLVAHSGGYAPCGIALMPDGTYRLRGGLYTSAAIAVGSGMVVANFATNFPITFGQGWTGFNWSSTAAGTVSGELHSDGSGGINVAVYSALAANTGMTLDGITIYAGT